MAERLYGLDGLRGIAALVVLYMHSIGFVGGSLAGGHLAVDFFFMLSGFVMARTYEGQLQAGSLSGGAFLVRRFRRLWPTMAVGASLGLVVALLTTVPSWELLRIYAFALLLVPASAKVPYLLNLPAWSIFYELLANALHGSQLARMGRSSLVIALGCAAVLFIGSFAIVGFPRILDTTTIPMQLLVVTRAVVSYVIGIMLFRKFGDVPPVRIPFAFAPVALIGYIALVSWNPFPLWPLPFVFLIAPVVLLAGIGELRKSRLYRLLGDISFPLYAVHFPVLGFVQWLDVGYLAMPLAWLICLTAAFLLSRLARPRTH